MRSLPASLTLVVAAILQAMGMYQYSEDSIVVSGQVFFPLLFALMAVYLAWRTKDAPRFGVVHAVVLVLGLAALIVTVVGKVTTNYALYPSWKIYYATLAVLVIELFFRILGTPRKVRPADQEDAPARRPRRRRRVAGQGPTHLVARPKAGAEKWEADIEPGTRTERGTRAEATDADPAAGAETTAGASRGTRG